MGQVSFVRRQRPEVSQQITDNRGQTTDKVFHSPVFTICHLSSDLCLLTNHLIRFKQSVSQGGRKLFEEDYSIVCIFR